MSDNGAILLEEIISVIDKYNNICITSHVNPDGDSIGSVLALGIALSKHKSKNITILIPEEIPKNLLFLPGIDLIKKDSCIKKLELLIALDCGDKNRIGIPKSLLESTDFILNIDHHITNTYFGDINIVTPGASSTGEIVYNVLKNMNIDLDKEIATNLYVAISTDTGSFRYDNTSSATHSIASKLFDYGIDINSINVNLYQSRSIEKTYLLIDSLNTLELLKNGKIAIAVVTKKMLQKYNLSINEADIIIDFIRDIDSVDVACLIKEIDEKTIKVGFRSKNNIDVSMISKNFGGGGHAKASGCTLSSNVDEGKKLILKEINKAFR